MTFEMNNRTWTHPRAQEIERVFQDNKDEIKSDLDALELSYRDMAKKYNVNDHNIRRWAERLSVDVVKRARERRATGVDAPKCRTYKAKQSDEPQAKKLVGLW